MRQNKCVISIIFFLMLYVNTFSLAKKNKSQRPTQITNIREIHSILRTQYGNGNATRSTRRINRTIKVKQAILKIKDKKKDGSKN